MSNRWLDTVAKRLKEPTSAALLSCISIILLLCLLALWKALSDGTVVMRTESAELQKTIQGVDTRLGNVEALVKHLQKTIEEPADSYGNPESSSFPLHTKVDAEKLLADLGDGPTAAQLAECLAELDSWVATTEDADAVQSLKIQKLADLRQAIKTELADLHQKALKAESGDKATEFHAKASQILAFYPVDSSEVVLDEARALSSEHSEVATRIDVIRRQRYNAWAMSRIEETIKAINEIATSFRTSDNPKTIEATVKHLGEVDPLLLEPVVAQLYNYAVEQAKSNVKSDQQLELGRRMIDPAIKRKSYGDF